MMRIPVGRSTLTRAERESYCAQEDGKCWKPRLWGLPHATLGARIGCQVPAVLVRYARIHSMTPRQLVERWTEEGATLPRGCTAAELRSFEETHRVRLPATMREYFLCVN